MKNFTTLLKESFEIYKEKIKPILIITLISVTGAVIFGILITTGAVVSLLAKANPVVLLLSLILGLIFILWFVFINLSFLILAVRPTGTKLREIFQQTWKKFYEYFWIAILGGLSVILSSFFLIIPGIIVAVYLMFSPYILIIEGEKGINALKASWALVKGNWLKVFGRLILLDIIFWGLFFCLNSINTFLGFVFQALTMPFSVIFIYLIYLGLKKSKEIQAPTPIQMPSQIS